MYILGAILITSHFFIHLRCTECFITFLYFMVEMQHILDLLKKIFYVMQVEKKQIVYSLVSKARTYQEKTAFPLFQSLRVVVGMLQAVQLSIQKIRYSGVRYEAWFLELNNIEACRRCCQSEHTFQLLNRLGIKNTTELSSLGSWNRDSQQLSASHTKYAQINKHRICHKLVCNYAKMFNTHENKWQISVSKHFYRLESKILPG